MRFPAGTVSSLVVVSVTASTILLTTTTPSTVTALAVPHISSINSNSNSYGRTKAIHRPERILQSFSSTSSRIHNNNRHSTTSRCNTSSSSSSSSSGRSNTVRCSNTSSRSRSRSPKKRTLCALFASKTATSTTGSGIIRSSPTNQNSAVSWLARLPKRARSSTPTLFATAATDVDQNSHHNNPHNNNRHSASDWLYNVQSLPHSKVLREIRNPVMAVFGWSLCVSLVHKLLLLSSQYHTMARYLCIPGTAHSFLVSALGLLLVFRTNSAYQRFNEGRKIWENILSVSRNMSRMIQLYGEEVGPENHKRITNLVAAYPYLLRQHIRPGCLCNPNDVVHEIPMQHRLLLHQQGYQRQETRHEGQESSSSSSNSRTSVSVFSTRDMTSPDETPENNLSSSATTAANSEDTNSPSSSLPLSLDCWVDKRELPWSLFLPQSLPAIARTENRPLWVCDRMAALICQIPYGPNFTSRERLCLLGMVDKLTNAVGQCERIHQTAVPLNYARHSLRSLTLWLFTLPFCLVQDFGIWFTAPANAAIAWLFFGVYQIGYSIEDPFQGSLRLSILCDAIRRSVIRQSTEQYGDDMKSEGDDRVALLSPPTSPLLEVSDPRATFSLTVPPSSSLFGHPPASASESTSRIVNAIRTRRQQQEDEKRRDSSAASPDNLDEIDTTITVDELRPEETMARVTEDMTKTLQEQIQQQLDLPTPKNVPSSLPTSEAAALVSSTSKSTIEQQNSSSHRTFAEPLPQTSPETSSSSKGLLIPKTGVDQSVFNMSTDYDLSLSPPPTLSSPHPLWIIDEELLQAPKIVRHHPNGTCTEIDI